AVCQHELHSFQDFGFCSWLFLSRVRTDSGRCEQRGCAVVIRLQRVCPQLQQETHERDICSPTSQQERCRPGCSELDGHVDPGLLCGPSIDIRSMRDKFSDEFEAIHISGSLWIRIVVTRSRPAMPGNLMQRSESQM